MFSNLPLLMSFRAIRHPASGYVQGINDLVTPFLVVFLSEYLDGSVDSWSISDLSSDQISTVEADCYWCLSKLLDGMQDHYTFAQPGIQRLVFKLKELVRRIDGKPSVFFFLILAPFFLHEYFRKLVLLKDRPTFAYIIKTFVCNTFKKWQFLKRWDARSISKYHLSCVYSLSFPLLH